MSSLAASCIEPRYSRCWRTSARIGRTCGLSRPLTWICTLVDTMLPWSSLTTQRQVGVNLTHLTSSDVCGTFVPETRYDCIALFPRPALRRGLSCVLRPHVTYFAYLDEFGHIGPYVSRSHPRFNDSPVFGLAGFVLPSHEVRGFGTWFYQHKCRLLSFEINRSGQHPALWEKKGASLYTATNVTKYRQLRVFTNRLFNKIDTLRGFVFYVGVKKTAMPHEHNPNSLYGGVFLEAIKRINDFCKKSDGPPHEFALFLDEHDQRPALITKAAQSMYAKKERRQHLIEPPFHLESHRYQTLQAADWISGLIGRLAAMWVDPAAYPENQVFGSYFEARLARSSRRSGVRR